MRRFTLLFIILGSVALAALLTYLAVSSARFGGRSQRAETAAASGERVTRPLPPFTRIDVTGTAEVTLVQGSAESVTLPANPPRKSRVDAEVRNGTLYVESTDDTRWWDMIVGGGGRSIPVTVTFRDIDAIAAAGTVRLNAGAIKVAALKISGAGGTQVSIEDLTTGQFRLSGAGALKAEIAGKADTQSVAISGAGDYRGGKLVSQDATVTVAGAGKVVVNAQKTLKATISGAGSVDYIGDPEVTKSVSGAGSVKRREVRGSGIAGVATVAAVPSPRVSARRTARSPS
jgi:hypothetical protein